MSNAGAEEPRILNYRRMSQLSGDIFADSGLDGLPREELQQSFLFGSVIRQRSTKQAILTEKR